MNRLAIIGAALAFAGCVDLGTTDKTDGDTGCATVPKNPTIETVDITCLSTREVEFTVTTVGVAEDGLVYSQDTANNPSWSDEHDLVLDEGSIDKVRPGVHAHADPRYQRGPSKGGPPTSRRCSRATPTCTSTPSR